MTNYNSQQWIELEPGNATEQAQLFGQPQRKQAETHAAFISSAASLSSHEGRQAEAQIAPVPERARHTFQLQPTTHMQPSSNSPRRRNQQPALGGAIHMWGSSARHRNPYHSIHAFHKKRTLASGFFNDKKITRASNKQFLSGLRGGLTRTQREGASMKPGGRATNAPSGSVTTRFQSIGQQPQPQNVESVTVSAERPLYSEIVDGGMPQRRVGARFQEPALASQTGIRPEAAIGGAPTWEAKNPLTTNFTLKSREHPGAGSQGRGNQRISTMRPGQVYPQGTMGRTGAQAAFLNASVPDGLSPRPGGFPIQANGSMSVMSLHGPGAASASPAGHSPGETYGSAHRRSQHFADSAGRRVSGRGSSLRSSPRRPVADAQQAQAIQRITITEKMNGKVRGAAGLYGSGADWSPTRRAQYGQNEMQGRTSPPGTMKKGGPHEVPSRAPQGKLTTVDQKLQHYARHSTQQSDGGSRYVTFQGEQIDNLKMSLGAESARNVTFYGQHQQAHGQHPSNQTGLSPTALISAQAPAAAFEPQVATNPRNSREGAPLQNLADEDQHYRPAGVQDGIAVVPRVEEYEEPTRLGDSRAPPDGGGTTGPSESLRAASGAAEAALDAGGARGEPRSQRAQVLDGTEQRKAGAAEPGERQEQGGDEVALRKRGTQRLEEEAGGRRHAGPRRVEGLGEEDQLADGELALQLASSADSGLQRSQGLSLAASQADRPAALTTGAEGFAQVAPGLVAPNLVKSMDEQQYAQNLQADGGHAIGLGAQKGTFANFSASTERTKTAGKTPQKPAGRIDLQEAGPDGTDGGVDLGLDGEIAGDRQIFPPSQMSMMHSEGTAAQVFRARPGAAPDGDGGLQGPGKDGSQPPLGQDGTTAAQKVDQARRGPQALGAGPAQATAADRLPVDSPSGQMDDSVMKLKGQILVAELSSGAPAESSQPGDEAQGAGKAAMKAQGRQSRGKAGAPRHAQVSPDSSHGPASVIPASEGLSNIYYRGDPAQVARLGVAAQNAGARVGPGGAVHGLVDPSLQPQGLHGGPGVGQMRRGLAAAPSPGADHAGPRSGAPGFVDGNASGEDEGQRNRMAVAIDYRAPPRVPGDLPEVPQRRLPEKAQFSTSTPKEPVQSTGISAPRIQDAADPEEALLLFFLEKMRHKHRLAHHGANDKTDKTEYMKYRPRQWETIEDRLKTLDPSSEVVREEASAANYRKDFVKQIQNHIKAIIETGKGVKVSTQAAFLEKEQKHLKKQANIGIKLSQLRTTWTEFSGLSGGASTSVMAPQIRSSLRLPKKAQDQAGAHKTGRSNFNQGPEQPYGDLIGRTTYNFDDLKSQSDSQVRASAKYLPHSASNFNAIVTDEERVGATPEPAGALHQACLQPEPAALGEPDVMEESGAMKTNKHSRSLAPLQNWSVPSPDPETGQARVAGRHVEAIGGSKDLREADQLPEQIIGVPRGAGLEQENKNAIMISGIHSDTADLTKGEKLQQQMATTSLIPQLAASPQHALSQEIKPGGVGAVKEAPTATAEGLQLETSASQEWQGEAEPGKAPLQVQHANSGHPRESGEPRLTHHAQILLAQQQKRRALGAKRQQDQTTEGEKTPGLTLAPLGRPMGRTVIDTDGLGLLGHCGESSRNLDPRGMNAMATFHASVDRPQPSMGSASNPEEALTSLRDYHAQYNRLEDVLKFTGPKVSAKLMMNGGRGLNERLDEIYNRLRDPTGNNERLRRNAIVNNKHRAGLAGWPAGSALHNTSMSNMSDGMSHAFIPGALQSSRHRRHNTSFFSTLDQPLGSMHSPEKEAIWRSDVLAVAPFQAASSRREQSVPPQSQWPGASESHQHSQVAVHPFRTLSTNRGSGAHFMRSGHPFEATLEELRDRHRRHNAADQDAVYYSRKLSLNAKLSNPLTSDRPPKMSEWIAQDVMLPILGKNKTSLLHSPDQLDHDSIAHQKHCLNRPHISPGLAGGGKAGKNAKRALLKEKEVPGQGEGVRAAPGRKLAEILQEKERQRRDMENREKAEERHLMKQIDKVATMMAKERDMATPEASRTQKQVALPQQEEPTVQTVPVQQATPGSRGLANGASSVPVTLLEEPTAHVGVSSLHSEEATLHRR